jgi:hypothetical protein
VAGIHCGEITPRNVQGKCSPSPDAAFKIALVFESPSMRLFSIPIKEQSPRTINSFPAYTHHVTNILCATIYLLHLHSQPPIINSKSDDRLAKIMTSGLRKSTNIFLLTGLVMVSHALADTVAANHALNAPVTQSCPASFFEVSLVANARQCQQFDDSLPASLVYFTKHTPKEVITFYQNAYPQLVTQSTVNQRTMLVATNDSVRIVVSPDKTGTQVDVLIVNKPHSLP